MLLRRAPRRSEAAAGAMGRGERRDGQAEKLLPVGPASHHCRSAVVFHVMVVPSGLTNSQCAVMVHPSAETVDYHIDLGT